MQQKMQQWVADACAYDERSVQISRASLSEKYSSGEAGSVSSAKMQKYSSVEPGSASSSQVLKEKDQQAKLLAATQRARGDANRKRLDHKCAKQKLKRMQTLSHSMAYTHSYSLAYTQALLGRQAAKKRAALQVASP